MLSRSQISSPSRRTGGGSGNVSSGGAGPQDGPHGAHPPPLRRPGAAHSRTAHAARPSLVWGRRSQAAAADPLAADAGADAGRGRGVAGEAGRIAGGSARDAPGEAGRADHRAADAAGSPASDADPAASKR